MLSNNCNKYRDTTAGIILSAYLLIFSINVFHFHKLELNGISCINVGNESNAKMQIPGSDFTCIIYQYFSSIHTSIVPGSSLITYIPDEETGSLIRPVQTYSDNKTFGSIHLRAPPYFS
jgi:hypothetical protein